MRLILYLIDCALSVRVYAHGVIQGVQNAIDVGIKNANKQLKYLIYVVNVVEVLKS